MAFIDVEEALCEYLEPVAPTYTMTGAFGTGPLEDENLPLIRINRTGGGSDVLGLEDSAIVEVQCFAVTHAASVALTSAVRALMAGAAGVDTPSGFVDSINESIAPNEVPYGEEYVDTRRTVSTWSVVSRTQ